jgi:polyhydroxyalkanoate synthesis regulator phasin
LGTSGTSGTGDRQIKCVEFSASLKGGTIMLELLRKSLMAGLGAVVLTTEKIQEAVRKLVEEGKISTEEGEKLAQDLVRSGERQWEEISTKMADTTKKWSENIESVKRTELEELKERLEKVEQRLAELEKGQTPQAEA